MMPLVALPVYSVDRHRDVLESLKSTDDTSLGLERERS